MSRFDSCCGTYCGPADRRACIETGSASERGNLESQKSKMIFLAAISTTSDRYAAVCVLTMVSMSRKRVRSSQRRRFWRQLLEGENILNAILVVTAVVFVATLLFAAPTQEGRSSAAKSFFSSLRTSTSKRTDRKNHPDLHVQVVDPINSESYNAIAYDILQALNCETLLNETSYASNRRRRLIRVEDLKEEEEGAAISREEPQQQEQQQFGGQDQQEQQEFPWSGSGDVGGDDLGFAAAQPSGTI